MLHCWLLSWGGRCTAAPGHMNLSSPSWDSSCSCSEVAVKGKKMQSEHSGLYKLRSMHWLLRSTHDYENWVKSVQRLLFIQTALFLSCFHVLCPSLPQGNQANGPECRGSGVWTESCWLVSWVALLNLSCAKWGRCRNLSVWASPDTLDTESRRGQGRRLLFQRGSKIQTAEQGLAGRDHVFPDRKSVV